MDVSPPESVRVDTSDQVLTIEWSDNHTSIFPLHALRQACPCANCQGESVEHIAPPRPSDASPPQRWTDLTIAPAGSVGIRIEWDDGHNAGIFRWDRLRAFQPPGPPS